VDFYKNRLVSEEDRAKTLAFLALEAECDEYNATQIEYMNRDHLNKTRSKQVDAAVKRWDKDNKRLTKRYKDEPTHSMGTARTWL
jgi:hypothetical protein